MKLGMWVGLSPGHIVLDGDLAPLPKKEAEPPIFGLYLLWPNAGWIKMASSMEMGLGQGHIVLDGDPAPLPQKGQSASPQFSAHFYCGQTAGWIKMPRGMEVGLGPGHIVQDGDRAPPLQKKGTAAQFSVHVHCRQTAGWTKMPLGMQVRLGPGDFVLNGDTAPPEKWHSPSNFWPMSTVAKLLDGSRCHLVRSKPRLRRRCVRGGPRSL